MDVEDVATVSEVGEVRLTFWMVLAEVLRWIENSFQYLWDKTSDVQMWAQRKHGDAFDKKYLRGAAK